MKRLIRFLLRLFGKLFSQFLNLRLIFRFYNYCYERLPYSIVHILGKYVSLPDKDSFWKIVLINKKYVYAKMIKDNLKTFHFALAYKWHSPALNFTEKILNDYYENDIPWIDVGANLGLRSLLSLSVGRPVYFIEPNKELNEINVERCKLNGFKNFKALEIGASDRKEEVEFYIDKSSYNSSIEVKAFDKKDLERKVVIKINTLDNLFKENFNEWECACIKIDVEGHELKVIEGAKEFIVALAPTIIIEVNKKDNHFSVFLNTMQGFGYTVYEIGNFGANKYYRKVKKEDKVLLESIKFNDFLAVKDKILESQLSKYELTLAS